MALATDELAQLLDHFDLTDDDVADATGAGIRTCQRWREGRPQRRRSKYDRNVKNLRSILRVFKDHDENADFVGAWLRSEDNPALGGGRALDLLRAGQVETVRRGALGLFDAPSGQSPTRNPPQPSTSPEGEGDTAPDNGPVVPVGGNDA